MSSHIEIYNSSMEINGGGGGKVNGGGGGKGKLERNIGKTIFSSNQENNAVGGEKGKVERIGGRTVLGEITSGTRIQPSRSVKQAHSVSLKSGKDEQENNCQTVKIESDDGNLDASVDNVEELDDSSVSNTSIWNDVPMAMDETYPGTSDEDPDYLRTPEYAVDIYRYLRKMETKNQPKWNYMLKQPEVTHEMRSILVDWLVEVATEYKLESETLHLTLSFIDRFMSLMSVQRSKLQLVGVAAMFVAAKYEEVYPPDVSDFVYITDDSYTKRQVLQMEQILLKVLRFDLSGPTSQLFLSKYQGMFPMDQTCVCLSSYINELSLVDGESFLRFSPSLVAASSLALARHTLGQEAWSVDMEETSGYSISDLKHCLLRLYQTYKDANKLKQQSIQNKYRSSKFDKVADIQPREIM